MTWGPSGETSPDKISKVTFEIQPYYEIVRLTVIHEELDDDMFAGISKGWPAVLANLKCLLETGHVLSRSPVEMAHQRTTCLAGTARQTGTGGSDGDER
jgi:hypothetical protein